MTVCHMLTHGERVLCGKGLASCGTDYTMTGHPSLVSCKECMRRVMAIWAWLTRDPHPPPACLDGEKMLDVYWNRE